MSDTLEEVFIEIEERIKQEKYKKSESDKKDKDLKVNIPALISSCL